MNQKNRKNTELNIAIILAVILLVVAIFTFTKKDQEKVPVIKTVEPEKKGLVNKPLSRPFEFKEAKEPEFLKAPSQTVELEDIPLETVASDEEESYEEETVEEIVEGEVIKRPAEIKPPSEDIKQLKKRGLIVY